MAGRPLLKAELKEQNSRDHLMSQRNSFLKKHGPDLGALYFVLMLLQACGRKALKRGDTEAFRSLARDLNAIYAKHTQ
ncbi:carbohydrate ABC transporter [Streptomyces microflavus]|uniref:carbohydrate ABC transporter n=1 Tax=Streptomyces microflavus TaxID=1919 RepID=UPI003669780B